jgi:hypothetical protein
MVESKFKEGDVIGVTDEDPNYLYAGGPALVMRVEYARYYLYYYKTGKERWVSFVTIDYQYELLG